MINPALFSSAKEDWATPQSVFDELDKEFGFVLDAAASRENAKCAVYYTKEQDCLKQDWAKHEGPVWINPPFRRAERACKSPCKKKKCPKRGYCIDTDLPGTAAFVTKAREEGWKVPVVCELPARTDADWWFKHVWDSTRRRVRNATEVRFHRKRRKYGDGKTGAPFPSVTVIFTPEHT